MAQIALPQTIDAGTPLVASEVQSNFVALRDGVNGDLEGGVGNNFKADGVTAREVANNVLFRAGNQDTLQEGVVLSTQGKVTPGSGLVLNYATAQAYISDVAGVIVGLGGLVPAAWGGSTVTIATNTSGNPRIDQVIATLSGWDVATVSVLQGTATAGATLDNRTGAAALPSGAIRLADILMPNGFAGPFVDGTHIRDRRRAAQQPYFRVGGSAASTGAEVLMTWGSATLRYGDFHIAGTEVTVQQAGIYSVSLNYFFNNTAADTRGRFLNRKNTVDIGPTANLWINTAGSEASAGVSDLVSYAAGDKITVGFLHSDGANNRTGTAALSLHRVGTA